MKYLVTPFTEAFATCTAAARKGRGEEVSRVGGQIAPPRKTKDVRPLYPPAAQEARVQGTVIIEATISPRGCVSAAHVIKSVPLLDVAALWAVAQWEYTPTLLNGTPVAVIMTVTSTFTLK